MSLSRQRESGFKKTRWSATQGLGRLRPHPSLPATSDGVGRWWCAAWPRSFWCHSEVCSERSQPMSRSHLEVAAVGRRRRKEKTEFLTKGRPVSRPAAARCTAPPPAFVAPHSARLNSSLRAHCTRRGTASHDSQGLLRLSLRVCVGVGGLEAGAWPPGAQVLPCDLHKKSIFGLVYCAPPKKCWGLYWSWLKADG